MQAGAAASACKRTTLSQQIDAEKRTGFGAGRGQGEGRLKFFTLKNLGVRLTNIFQHPQRYDLYCCISALVQLLNHSKKLFK